MASSTLLGSMAQVLGNLIIDRVADYVTSQIASQDWKRRNSAVLMLGMVLEGPSYQALKPLLHSATPVLL